MEMSLPFLESAVAKMTLPVVVIAVYPIQIQVWALKPSQFHPLHAHTTGVWMVDAAADAAVHPNVVRTDWPGQYLEILRQNRVHVLTLQRDKIIHYIMNLSQKMIFYHYL